MAQCIKKKKIEKRICLNPFALRMAKTPLSFGHSEYNRVKNTFLQEFRIFVAMNFN